ncbi:CinA family protein [Salinibacterium soli]|uniref:CinA family protein n=1 Tax=Antiquaquibacter soli TaxID=3064523 RepID=A0ABT9BQB1_9MICO|nr:CinA family protein [Protaetiibacter sp. WY-16]MDO7882608.1 CinA family protein [Protaetiibacter sp. WY-16]
MTAAERLSHRAASAGLTVAVAESLTCGRIASALGATPGSSGWFLGGVIAYDNEVKFGVLGVRRGPVVSGECAREMAEGVARLTKADLAIAVTGVGGPAHAEDQPPGTVFIAATFQGETIVEQRHFPGPPDRVLDATIERALELGLRASLGD